MASTAPNPDLEAAGEEEDPALTSVRVSVDLLATALAVDKRDREGVPVIVDPFGGGAASLVTLDRGQDEVHLVEPCTLRHIASAILSAGKKPWVADLVNARPAMSRLAREVAAGEIIRFAAVAGDGVFAAGVLIRVLLEEFELAGLPVILDDSAGVAIAVASQAEDLRSGLLMSDRGRRFDEENPNGVSAAADLDSVATCAKVVREEGIVRVKPV